MRQVEGCRSARTRCWRFRNLGLLSPVREHASWSHRTPRLGGFIQRQIEVGRSQGEASDAVFRENAGLSESGPCRPDLGSSRQGAHGGQSGIHLDGRLGRWRIHQSSHEREGRLRLGEPPRYRWLFHYRGRWLHAGKRCSAQSSNHRLAEEHRQQGRPGSFQSTQGINSRADRCRQVKV